MVDSEVTTQVEENSHAEGENWIVCCVAKGKRKKKALTQVSFATSEPRHRSLVPELSVLRLRHGRDGADRPKSKFSVRFTEVSCTCQRPDLIETWNM